MEAGRSGGQEEQGVHQLEEKDAIRTRLRDEDSVRKTLRRRRRLSPVGFPGGSRDQASYHLRDKDFVDGVYRFEQIIRSRTTIQFLFRNVISGAATTYTMHSIRDVAFFSPIEKRRSLDSLLCDQEFARRRMIKITGPMPPFCPT